MPAIVQANRLGQVRGNQRIFEDSDDAPLLQGRSD